MSVTSSPQLKLERVSKRYRMGDAEVTALQDVSLSLEGGFILSLAGPSGSGKSTLLNLLAGFDHPDSGSIIVAGQSVSTLRGRQLDRYRNVTLGFIFQHFNLVPTLSALENVELALLPRPLNRREKKQKAEEVVSAVGLYERRHHRPWQLSGGQQQRIAIARALVVEPQLILADEPTGSLDQKTTDEIMALIARLNAAKGTSFLIATHNNHVMEQTSHTLRLVDGRVMQ